MRNTKDFEAKYNKVKAKLALLSSSASAPSSFSSKNKGLIAESHDLDEEEVSSDDEETGVKAFMSLTDKEKIYVGKESARNDEWTKITKKSNLHKSSEAEDSTQPNHDTNELKSTFKADTLKGITLNKPSSAPARGNKCSSASKTNLAPAGKLKNVNMKDNPSLAMVMKELNELKLQISKKKSSYSKNKNTQQKVVSYDWVWERGFNKKTLIKSLFPPRWRLLMAQIIQCLWGKTGGFDQITNKDEIILYSLANDIHMDYANIFWEDIILKLKKKKREDEPVVFKAQKTSSRAESVSQGVKPRAKTRHKKPVTSSKQPSMSSKVATKGGSSKAPTGSKTGHSKRRKESSSAMDSNPSWLLVSTHVDTEMHKEDQQATSGPTSLGVTDEKRSNSQLNFTTEVDPGLFAPNDSIPPQQCMDEGTKNTSYDHISTSTDPHGASSTAIYGNKEEASTFIHDDKEVASSTIKLEDLAKLVSQIQPSFKDLDSLEDDPVIIVDESKEDEPNAKIEDTSIEADDQAIQTILLGLPKDIYAVVDSCETDQKIWLRVQQMMKGSDIGIQENKVKLFNKWERFTSNDGESIESYYHRFLKLMNDLKRNKHFPKKIANNLKFLNNLHPEWSRHVTIVHQKKDLHTADYTQLYDFLKYNQKEVDELKAKQLVKTQDPLALMATSNNPYTFTVPHQDQPSFSQNYMQQPMPNPEDITDPTTAMNMALTLMAKAFKLNYSTPTNNNQRISSNLHNRQIAQPECRESEWVQCSTDCQESGNANHNLNGNGNLVAARAEGNAAGHNGNQIRCYNYRRVGHFARNCTGRPRRRDAAYLQTQLLIAQKEEAGIQLQAKEFDLMAVAADLDEIEEVNANCILMANLQQASTSGTQTNKAPVYDSDGSAEVHDYENCYDIEIFNMFTQEEQYTEVLKPILDSHQVPPNDNNVISEREECKFDKISYDKAYNDMQQKIERLQAQLGDLKGKRVDNTKTRRPQPRSNTKNDRVPSASKSSCNKNKGVKVEERHRNLLLSKNKEHMSSACNHIKFNSQNVKSKVVCAMCKQCLISVNHDVIQICLWCVDSSCSKRMTGNLKLLINFVWKFLGTVHFGNDHVAVILGFGDLQWGNILITRVYFVEGLGHNLFSVGQFCDSDLEAAFRRNACFVRNLEGVDLLSGNCTTKLYTINLHDMASASPICLMARASSTKSWFWPQRLPHLNFDTINDLAKNDLVSGLPKFKYHKEHLCPSYEAPEVIKTFLKRVTILLQSPVIIIRTDNGTKFINQGLKEYFDSVGISHQVSSVRTPQQNEVVERRNQTLVEAARTMLIFPRAPLFLWAEAIATACFTQNRSIIHRRFNKTSYELINGRKPDISFLHVFGALCYPKNDHEDIGKLGTKGGIGFFIGYSADSCAFRIYNRRTKKIMETMNVSFDELSAMAFEQHSLKPGLQSMTSGQISSRLDLAYAPSTITTQQPTKGELDLLFEAMHDDYIGGQLSATPRTDSAAQAQ
uniref:Integrase, catalytic region, zinc finger, CCHC-type, peptidase aspartic, catalytic n=1 Tax=Tanacetum cinerariifolium TaxID=118510 RepID=A0A6L2M244_TANCI|nr:integrase, catalytic region, zinc finger, CCHC-type, peptidase aspartic, catalytic [Tanacetum cinerariifolium]